jgi:protease IV
MVGFLRWGGSIVGGTINGMIRFALAIVLFFLLLFLIDLAEGDGLPRNMVLALDLRQPIADSSPIEFEFRTRPLTVMDIVLGLDAAERDSRVKGVVVRLGSANLPVAQAEEIGTALKKFRQSGKFVIAHSQGFEASGLGDYLAAASADQIWMQPKSPFGAAGEGGGEIFLRGLFDKLQAEPQIAKRADYKSAADMYMEKNMTAADREQVTALLQSWYDTATNGAAAERKLKPEAVHVAFEASPQMSETAKKAGLIDRLGYDDDAVNEALSRAGSGARTVSMVKFIQAKDSASELARGPRVALIETAGEIVEGSTSGDGMFGQSRVIAGDDVARAIRQATRDREVKAILLRVDSPGGSVTASDQILDAVKKAQAKGIPVVVSMGSVAASGGYYIATSADRIVAEPGTITGSIGVLTGKVSFNKSLALAGVGADQVGVGKNALMDSDLAPYTDDQWKALNDEADAIYADFKQKVSAGRKLPLDKVQDIARGRVWSGADANARGLVDQLGGFWTALDATKKLAKIDANERVALRRFPEQKSVFDAVRDAFGGTEATVRAMQGFVTLMNAPPVRALVEANESLPRSGIELRATNLPR